ncbi:hypothetical protein MesoLjLb_31030 [Mesorhizobium sp. L-8-3]|nr:hypothetical protein MesoLjLb_31030 [Mesorhizobium sp. L-8-3]
MGKGDLAGTTAINVSAIHSGPPEPSRSWKWLSIETTRPIERGAAERKFMHAALPDGPRPIPRLAAAARAHAGIVSDCRREVWGTMRDGQLLRHSHFECRVG